MGVLLRISFTYLADRCFTFYNVSLGGAQTKGVLLYSVYAKEIVVT